MPRIPLMALALLPGALGAFGALRAFDVQSPARAPTLWVMGVSAPDGRDMPDAAPDVLRAAPRSSSTGIGRSGASDPSSPGRPSQSSLPIVIRPTPAKPPPAPSRPNTKANMPPPIAFFVARGEADACGSGCSEWIGADGAIDAGAATRLRALLNRLGQRRLPVFFHSPGGSVEGSLAIGRLMRAHGLTAGVARTIPQGCDPKQSREEACDRIKRSGRDLPAELDTGSTMCFSACVYAVAGAAVREIGAAAKLGVHSSSFKFAGIEDRASARPPGRVMRATIEASYERLARYFVEMGVDPSLVTAAREIANDHIRVLTRADIWRFKIDRRSFVEDGWRLMESPRHAISKAFVAERAGGGADFRDAVVNVACGAADRLRVDVALERATNDTTAGRGIRLLAGGAERMLLPRRRMTFGSSRTEYDISGADLPPAFLAAAGSSIRLSTAAPGSSAPSASATDKSVDKFVDKSGDFTVTLSMAGLAPALAKLLPLCGMNASALKALASPRSVP